MADRPVLVDVDDGSQDVEITPEMVAAGISAFEWFAESVDPGYLVAQVYIAMARASRPAALPPQEYQGPWNTQESACERCKG